MKKFFTLFLSLFIFLQINIAQNTFPYLTPSLNYSYTGGAPQGYSYNDAQFVAQAFPTDLITGQTFYAEIRFKNTGNTVWTTQDLFSLGSQNPQDNNTWGTNRIQLPQNVAPGEEITFAVNLTAPSTPGTYNFQWRMVQDGVEWFGQASDNIIVTVSPANPINDAQFVAQAFPTDLITGQTFYAEIRFKNTGNTVWSSQSSYSLGSQSPQDNYIWGTNRIQLPQDVAPGEEITFAVNLTAPSTPGTYNFQWRMVQDGVEWFGQASDIIYITVNPANPVNNAQFISQTIPNQVNTNDNFTVSLRFKNTGNTIWTTQDLFSLGSQNPQDNNIWGINRIQLPQNVAPGEEITFNANLTAPSTPGTYNFQWRMVQDGVEWFGEASNNISINVTNSTVSNQIQLIQDPKFQSGFFLVDANMNVIGNIHTNTGNNPAWELAELCSQSSLLNMTPEVLPSGFYKWANNFKDFRVGPEDAEEYDYYIGVNSIEEWNRTYMPVTEQEYWPAFLVQQRLSAPFRPENNHGPGCPTLAEMSSLNFSMDARLLYNYTLIQDGYDPEHHAAQFPIYFTVQNLNPQSPGYGQYIWLGILVFDDRYYNFEGHYMMDVHTQALIWTLPDNASRTESLHDGNWVHLQVDLLPYAIQALHTAWDNNIMTASTNLADYRIGGMNMGWENPGMNVCTMVTRDMSLTAELNSSYLTYYNNNRLSEIQDKTTMPPFINTGNVPTNIKQANKINISILPNPVTNFAVVKAFNENISKIEITNITGKKLKLIDNINKKQIKIDMSDLKNGIYLLKVYSENKIKVNKIVKK